MSQSWLIVVLSLPSGIGRDKFIKLVDKKEIGKSEYLSQQEIYLGILYFVYMHLHIDILLYYYYYYYYYYYNDFINFFYYVIIHQVVYIEFSRSNKFKQEQNKE